MQWTRTETIGLSNNSCAHCHGYGTRIIRHGREVPCHCVFRAVFRACYNRFRECVDREKHMSTVTLEYCRGTNGYRSYGRRTEEYIADFCLVSARELDEFEKRIFRYHFLLGADWKLCCRMLKLERGQFFHIIYRIEHRLGRVFAELEPYSLYPLDEYFGGAIRKKSVQLAVVATQPRPAPRRRLEVPLAKLA